jgi:hypothetical protein
MPATFSKEPVMKRRFALLLVSLVAAGSLQVFAAPAASACADPHCPWSPVTDYVGRLIYRVRQICIENIEVCPLP